MKISSFEGNLSNAANAVFAANVAIVGGANVLFLGSFGIKTLSSHSQTQWTRSSLELGEHG
jgi:hypothetical protein